jgi:hypothetical protein
VDIQLTASVSRTIDGQRRHDNAAIWRVRVAAARVSSMIVYDANWVRWLEQQQIPRTCTDGWTPWWLVSSHKTEHTIGASKRDMTKSLFIFDLVRAPLRRDARFKDELTDAVSAAESAAETRCRDFPWALQCVLFWCHNSQYNSQLQRRTAPCAAYLAPDDDKETLCFAFRNRRLIYYVTFVDIR